jgi:hypothetical protein
MSQAPFVIQPRLTAMTLGYRNKNLIADAVARRIPVGSPLFKWSLIGLDTFLTPINDQVARKGRVQEVDWNSTEQTSSTEDHALQEAVPAWDREVALANAQYTGVTQDPEATASVLVTDLVAINREMRVASLWSNPANYAANQVTALAGTAQWDAFATSDPVGAIMAAMDSMIVRPNAAVTSQKILTVMRRHPKVVNAFYGGQANAGVAPLSFLLELLGLEKLNVGQSWINVAKRGQPVNMQYIWGNVFSLYVDNPLVNNPEDPGLTFGYTAQFGDRIAGTIPDPNIGMRGGNWVRVGEALKELIVAPMAGYLFTNVLSTG